jgi:hypothetical protein
MIRAGGVPSDLWAVTRVYMPPHGGIEHAYIESIAGIAGFPKNGVVHEL